MLLRNAVFGLSCWLLSSGLVWANSLENIRIWPAPHETRVVIDLSSEPDFSYFTITETKPFRLVIDLADTTLAMKLPQKVTDSQILKKIRRSKPVKKGSYRLVFELKNQVDPRIFPLSPLGEYGHRIVVDLPHEEEIKLIDVVEINEDDISVSEPTETELPFGNDDIVIAIDPGHGGNDPGAVGPRRKYEKHVTLSIARHTAKLINSVKGMKAVLTRDGDYFVDLDKRSEIARKNKAHFLISYHADGFTQPEPNGASVWVLSRTRANNEIGRWIEQHEKQSELLGGGAILQQHQDEHLSRALLDLQFSNSQKEGYQVAVKLLEELGKVTKLHKDNPEHASLAVLKSPDIPSVLVEAGFITNPEEETLLLSRYHQERIAEAVFHGVRSYFEENPPDGTLFAAIKNGNKHIVKEGESLSLIAEKYQTTVEEIKIASKLTSNEIRTGQALNIYTESTETPPPRLIEHRVRYGEYLGKIAGNYGVSIKDIREANALLSDEIKIGQILIIPGM